MISIGKFLGHDEKFYDLLEASAQQADTSVHHLVDLLAKVDNKDSFRDLTAFAESHSLFLPARKPTVSITCLAGSVS